MADQIYKASDGTTHVFPADATLDEIQSLADQYEKSLPTTINTKQLSQNAAISGGGPGAIMPMPPQVRDTALGVIRPIIASAAGDAAAAAAAPVPVPGSSVAAYGGAYSLTDALMQYLQSKKPNSFSEALGTGAVNAGVQKVLGSLVNAGARGVKAFNSADMPDIYHLAPTTSQAAAAMGMPKLAGVAKNLEDMALSSKQEALDRSAGKGFTEALRLANNSGWIYNRNPNTQLEFIQQHALNSGMIPPESFSQLDKVIGDAKALKAVKQAAYESGVGTNLEKSLQGYQFMKMFQDATERDLFASPSLQNTKRLDVSKFEKTWLDPKMEDSFKELYNSKERANITQFFKNVAETQDKITVNPIAKRFWVMHGGIGLGMGMLTGSPLEGAGAAGASYLGVYLGAQQVGKMLTNPSTARLLVALAGGEPLGYSEQFAAKQITRALQGSMLGLIKSDGSVQPARLQDGKIQPLGQ